jgi:hypothetical protein
VSLGLLAGTFLRLAAMYGSSHTAAANISRLPARRVVSPGAGMQVHPTNLPLDLVDLAFAVPSPPDVLNGAAGRWDTLGGGLVRHHPKEATMVEVGDRVLVESEKVGSVTRSGVVTAVDGRLITVRWDAGSQSVFVPSAGSLQVTGHEPPGREPDSS